MKFCLLNLLLMSGEHVLWRDVADGAIQTHVVVMLYVTPARVSLLCEKVRTPVSQGGT